MARPPAHPEVRHPAPSRPLERDRAFIAHGRGRAVGAAGPSTPERSDQRRLLARPLDNLQKGLWPDIFFNYAFWMRRQALFDVLKLLIGVEIALRAFRVFPGARAAWERLLAASVVIATTLGFWFLPREAPYSVMFAHQPQINAASVWLFTVTSLVIVHYRIPVDPWHRAILLAFVPYLLVFTTTLATINALGASINPAMGFLDSVAYLVLIAYWAQTAWRP
jgi:hypothetical protein